MNNELLLLSKADIPFIEAQISVHQPTLKEISMIGEEAFFSATQLFSVTKENLENAGNIDLEGLSDFDIIMSIVQSVEGAEHKKYLMMLFALLFPEYNMKFTENEIILYNDKTITRINNSNYDSFKDIISSMFNLNSSGENQGYNPIDERARRIAEKLKKGKEKVAQNTGENSKVAVFSRYASILSVGLGKDLNDIMEYSVFQLMDEFERFQKKQSFEMYVQAKMAGAKDLSEVENWMGDIHSNI